VARTRSLEPVASILIRALAKAWRLKVQFGFEGWSAAVEIVRPEEEVRSHDTSKPAGKGQGCSRTTGCQQFAAEPWRSGGRRGTHDAILMVHYGLAATPRHLAGAHQR
jgi:hypothetical protein